jgi:glutamine amidotransferase
LILPGVGHFGAFMSALRRSGLDELIVKMCIIERTPILGICVGAQAMLEGSEEDKSVTGLGWVKGMNTRLSKEDSELIPRVGWDVLRPNRSKVPIDGLAKTLFGNGNRFYFSHSYKFNLSDNSQSLIATSGSKSPIPVVFLQRNLLGVQFHPERSQVYGVNFLRAFCRWTGDDSVT